ncbi:hypothetical protein NDU88_005934 [Pleurodeles waltl]|uniref:Uncharacterized protein n=1 Tax=Pleurodeles waltl TaxID=8319 RepID=A0AAV7QMQ6_PLEWA|nr:hypothetical protein NDU88_005934 [Pleurodeles waltl]
MVRGGAQPSTSDLCWQKEVERGRSEPGEQRAALRPWREEKVEPSMAGWSSSTEATARRTGVADAARGRYGGMGFAPTGVAVPRERRPGPSGMQKGLCVQYVEAAWSGEWQQLGSSAAGLHVLDIIGDEECELDFEERSIEEGELFEEGEEEEWWVGSRGGG